MKFTIGTTDYTLKVTRVPDQPFTRLVGVTIYIAFDCPSSELLGAVLGELVKARRKEYGHDEKGSNADWNDTQYVGYVFAYLYRQLVAQGGEPALLALLGK